MLQHNGKNNVSVQRDKVLEPSMKKLRQKPTLYKPTNYQIEVFGHLDESWVDWAGGMTITVGSDEDGLPFSTLTGKVDQAALLGLLRQLYSMGLPLISVICVDFSSDDS